MKHGVLVTFAKDDILFHSENYKHILFLESIMWDTKARVIYYHIENQAWMTLLILQRQNPKAGIALT